MEAGASLPNAVLAEIHRAAREDPDLADEFVGHLLQDIVQLGHGVLGTRHQHLLDTEDLVQSMLKDLWPVLAELEFQSRARFLSLLSQRLRWKAQNRVRDLRSAKRREDLREQLPLEEVAPPLPGASPSSIVASEEERSRLARLLERLPEKELRLVQLHLDGQVVAEIARLLDQPVAETRRELRKAMKHARELLQP